MRELDKGRFKEEEIIAAKDAFDRQILEIKIALRKSEGKGSRRFADLLNQAEERVLRYCNRDEGEYSFDLVMIDLIRDEWLDPFWDKKGKRYTLSGHPDLLNYNSTAQKDGIGQAMIELNARAVSNAHFDYDASLKSFGYQIVWGEDINPHFYREGLTLTKLFEDAKNRFFDGKDIQYFCFYFPHYPNVAFNFATIEDMSGRQKVLSLRARCLLKPYFTKSPVNLDRR